jgi:hypothetical protein
VNLQRWLEDRRDEQYMDALMRTKGAFDANVKARIDHVLWAMRFWRKFMRYTKPFSELSSYWRTIYGRHWNPGQTVHGSPSRQSGGGAGGAVQTAGSGYAFAPMVITNPAGPVAPASFQDAGIRAGEVKAYRCWYLGDDGFLTSVFQDHVVWQPGKPMEGDPNQVMQGVHAFKTRLGACQYMGDEEADTKIVSGTVELWGEVREHARGYRAQYAKIVSIDDSPHYDAKALRVRYGLE